MPLRTERRQQEVGLEPGGAIEVVHGIGENIRGTTLGAMDTITHDRVSKNDETARQGRMEAERGLAKLRGQGSNAPGAANYGSGGGLGATNPITGGVGSNAARSHGGNGAAGYGPNAASNQATDGMAHGFAQPSADTAPATENTGAMYGSEAGIRHQGPGAHHHRDDGVTNLPPPSDQKMHPGGQADGATALHGAEPNQMASAPHRQDNTGMMQGGSYPSEAVAGNGPGVGGFHPNHNQTARDGHTTHGNMGTGGTAHVPLREKLCDDMTAVGRVWNGLSATLHVLWNRFRRCMI
ncbi:hypothetical protein BD779DRAFT_1162468 [Infundibulicybe gibba]|nr:hypothetical protein BD779DRAFT_1162468 [Infundibulicybe gibba]